MLGQKVEYLMNRNEEQWTVKRARHWSSALKAGEKYGELNEFLKDAYVLTTVYGVKDDLSIHAQKKMKP